MAPPTKQKMPKGRAQSSGVPITDPRFANIQTDPRFRLPSKKNVKTKLDKRFAHMLKDDDFSRKASVDRYGRKIEKGAGKKELERFYRVEDEDEEEQEEGEDDDVVLKELARVSDKSYDPIREGGFSESSSEESSSEEEDEEVDIEDKVQLAPEKEEVPMGEVSSRLAAVNMDWDNIRAVDLMAVASSFAPADGRILSVTIYPSEFGRARMDREEIEGPPKEVFAASNHKSRKQASASPEPSDSEVDEEQIKKDLLKEGDNEDFDSTALRAYQLDRLRYYYAVLTCSSPSVGKVLYDNMDGREYLSSANFFDLRFVPDEVEFDEKPHDTCDQLPDAYRPNEFTTDALTHSKVKLTWDADDTTRQEVQKRAFSRKEIDENDLAAYIGSDTSSSSEDESPEPTKDSKKDKAAALRAALGLGASDAPATKSAGMKRDREFKKPESDMQITFSAGLSASAPKDSVFENEPIIEETTIEKYIRKERERKARRKERAKAAKTGNEADVEADTIASRTKDSAKEGAEEDPFNDPFFASPEPENAQKQTNALRKAERAKKRAEREKEEAANAAQRAELELLMVDDDKANMRHFDMNEIMKVEKAKKKKKGKKSRKGDTDVGADQGREDAFQMDVQDPRFAKLYESHEFAIDPTNPRFKGTEGMKALLEEGRRKRKHGDESGVGEVEKKRKKEKGEGGEVDDLKKLAAKVKARSKKI